MKINGKETDKKVREVTFGSCEVFIEESIARIVRVKEGSKKISFLFEDGVMTEVCSTLPFKKDREDWTFFSKAIDIMLDTSRKFYKKAKTQVKQDSMADVPF